MKLWLSTGGKDFFIMSSTPAFDRISKIIYAMSNSGKCLDQINEINVHFFAFPEIFPHFFATDILHPLFPFSLLRIRTGCHSAVVRRLV